MKEVVQCADINKTIQKNLCLELHHIVRIYATLLTVYNNNKYINM